MTTITNNERADLAIKYASASGKGITDITKKSAVRYFEKLEKHNITAAIIEDYFNAVIRPRGVYRNIYQDILTARDILHYMEENGRDHEDHEETKEETPEDHEETRDEEREHKHEETREDHEERDYHEEEENRGAALAASLEAFVKQYSSATVDAAKVREIVRDELASASLRHITYDINGVQHDVKGITHARFNTVLSMLAAHEYPYLHGPAGTGKNIIAKQAAEALGINFYYQSQIFQPYEIKGYVDANGVYQKTEFYKAFKNGGLFMLDEVDASTPEAVTVLNDALANGAYTFPNGERLKAPDTFYCIAAGNTLGKGASDEYTARNALDASTLDRFSPLFIDYDEKIENSLTSDTELLAFIRATRKACTNAGVQLVVSYRAIIKIEKFKSANMTTEDALTCGLFKHLERDDIRMILHELPAENAYTTATKHAYNIY